MAFIGQAYITNNNSNNIFEGKQVVKLGVQGAENATFFINSSDTRDIITLGATGIYELDLTNIGVITVFKTGDLQGKGLLVDYIYNTSSGEAIL